MQGTGDRDITAYEGDREGVVATGSYSAEIWGGRRVMHLRNVGQ